MIMHKSFAKMSNKELARVQVDRLSRNQLNAYIVEISDRRRRMLGQIREFDEVIREVNTRLSRV